MRAAVAKWLTSTRQVHADHPIAVALIGAAGEVTAAVIIAGATLAAAVIVAAGEAIGSGDGDGKDGDGDGDGQDGTSGGGDVSPGDDGSEHRRRLGKPDLPVNVRDFINRDIVIAAAAPPPTGGEDQHVTATADYRFDGDVNAQSRFRAFSLKDTLTFRFDIANLERAEDATLVFKVENLNLSTVDVATTRGHSAIRLTAVQGDRVLWRWSARVEQGQPPQLEGLPGGSDATIQRAKDLLTIRNLEIPLEYRAPGANRTTRVEVVVEVDGEGVRV